MQHVRGTAVIGVVLAYALAAGGAEAWPGCACRTGWAAGPIFNGGAPATSNWTQLNIATSATGNSNQIIGSTGPITVTQTSGPVLVYSNGPPPAGQAGALNLAGILLGGTSPSGAASSGSGGLVNVGSGSNGGLVQTNLGGVTTNGIGTGPVTVGSASAPLGLAGSSAGATGAAGLQAAGGAASGAAITTPLPVAVGGTAGAPSVSPGASSAGSGTGLGAGSSVQLCASCLTGGVGG